MPSLAQWWKVEKLISQHEPITDERHLSLIYGMPIPSANSRAQLVHNLQLLQQN